MTAKPPTPEEIQKYQQNVLARYGVALPDDFARDQLAFVYQVDQQLRDTQAELEALRDAFQDTKKTRTRRGKSEVRSS